MACSSACNFLLAEGKARLVDRHTVEVTLPDGGKRRLTTKNILLAQGGRPIKADVPGKVNVQLDCHEHHALLQSAAIASCVYMPLQI